MFTYVLNDSVTRKTYVAISEKEILDDTALTGAINEFRNLQGETVYAVEDCLQYVSNKLGVSVLLADDMFSIPISHPSLNTRNKSLKFGGLK